MLCLWAGLGTPAWAGELAGGNLTLDAGATYQGYEYHAGWLDRREQALQEEVRATFAGFLLDQSIARYKLGAALDNRTIFEGGESSDVVGWQYDLRLDTWPQGTIPVSLYANHGVSVPDPEAEPSHRAVADIAGFRASLADAQLPRVDTYGRLQETEWRGVDDIRRERTTELGAGVSRTTERSVARASGNWETVRGPEATTFRDVRRANMDFAFEVDDDVHVLARADARSYLGESGSARDAIGTSTSEAMLRYRLTDRTSGNTWVQNHRSVLDDSRTSGTALSTDVSHQLDAGLHVDAGAGATYDQVDDARFVGEFVRSTLGRSQTGVWGSYDTNVTAGLAHFTEVYVDSGLQGGAAVQGSVARDVFRYLRLYGGAEVAGQVDSSRLDHDYAGYGWRGGFSTRRLHGFEMGGSASGSAIRQLSQAEGDSDRLRVDGSATFRGGGFLTAQYVLAWERLQLDDEYSRGLGHSVRVDVKPTGTVGVGGIAHHTRWETSEYDPTEWFRLEATASWWVAGFVLQARANRDLTVAGDDERVASGILVSATRRFGWRF
ncbi:MAG: hypothetical protein ACOZNI_11795 [Myxococcota bacterium]